MTKLSDGKGMFLAVYPNGSKLWRLKYDLGGRERSYSIGPYPDVTLVEARAERERAREWLRAGRDPVVQRKVEKATVGATQGNTFATVAAEWLAAQSYTKKHAAQQRQRLDDFLVPNLGSLPVGEITPAILLETLRAVERRGKLDTAKRCRAIASMVFRYAVQTVRATTDPAAMLRGALKPSRSEARATIPLKEMPALFKALAKVPAERNTKLAAYWLILTASRSAEMRFATWGEIADDVWRIPADRMKMDREHVVPLVQQTRSILLAARPLRTSDEDDALIFPGFTRHGALSENAILALLARAGFYGRQTGHGFRSSFSTWAHEVAEADPDVIEACLAHAKEGVRGIYNRASYLSQRRKLLAAWAEACTSWGMKLK